MMVGRLHSHKGHSEQGINTAKSLLVDDLD